MSAMLAPARRAQAVEFMTTQARPLERALYRFHFENAPATDVLDVLSTYQNADGGFGNALEPDIRLPDSSAIATTIAFQIFRDLCPPGDHPLIVQGCAYLRDTYDAVHGVWWIVPPNVDAAPHAPWWAYRPDPAAHALNPRAEIAGYLHDYAKHFSQDMVQRVTDAVTEHLLALDAIEMHDLLCVLRLYDTPNLPDDRRERITGKLTALVRTTVEHDPARWKDYNLQPLDVAPTPESPFASLFGDLIERNLDALIAQQRDDGSWKMPVSWGGTYPETWPQVEREWSGVLTLKNLRILDAYGRLG